jgi:GNAT superfamily N-acetyltransferase
MIPRPVAPDYTGWDIVLRLILDYFAYMEGRIDPPSSAHRLTVPEMAEQAGTGAVWVVEEAGCPVACLFAKAAGDALYLGKLAVSTSHRGRGLAWRLVAVAEEEARSRGLVWLELETRIELTENHAAFAHLGFVKVAETAHPGYARPTSITMRKRL